MGLAGARFDRRIVYGASLDFRHAGGNADDHARLGHDRESFMHFADEVVQHQLGDIEVADHTVLQRPHRDDIRGRAAHHPLGIGADRERPLGLGVNRHDRRLVDDDTLAANEDKGIRRTEVDADVTGEHDP